MKKIYLCVDWESRSIGVSTKKDWDEYKKYLKEENKCGEYKDGDNVEIYNEEDEDSSDSMVELKVDDRYYLVD